MNVIKKFFCQCARPEGILGRAMLRFMNFTHSPLNIWGLGLISFRPGMKMLDIGCGGGATIKRLLKRSPEGTVFGIDISEESVRKACEVNSEQLEKQVFITIGTAEHLQFDDDTFDLVTAVETIYFWPNIADCFKEVRRVLKTEGRFVIIQEVTDKESHWKDIVNGMNVYTCEQLKEMLENAGFTKIEIHYKKPFYQTIIAQ